MPASDLHLTVSIAAWWTTAVASHGDTPQAVMFDGQPALPSGVHQDPDTGTALTGTTALTAGLLDPDRYQPDPMQQLVQTPTAEPPLDPVAAAAALLGHVGTVAARQIGAEVTALTVVTAQPWGHRARQRLTEAATTAGLPQPHIVTAAAAAAALAQPSTQASHDGHGPFIAVCLTGDSWPQLSVLDTATAYTQLATTAVRDPAAPAIDDQLIAHVATTTPDGAPDLLRTDWRLAREVHQARTVLATQPRASVLLPEPHPPTVLRRDEVTAAAAAHLDRIDDAVNQMLRDADLDRADISATVVVGTDATVRDLPSQLTKAGLPTPTTRAEPHAIALGAARVTHPLATAATTPTAATLHLPRARLTIGNLAGIIVLAACSVALLIQSITTADIYTIAGRVTGVRLPVENLSLAAAIAAATAWAAGQLVPTTWLPGSRPDDQAATGHLLRRAYLTAAAAGLALAGLWGLGASVAVNYSSGHYLRATLTAAAPLAASATVIALATPRIPAAVLPTWLPRARPPATAIAVAAAGVYLQRAAGTLTFPTDLTGMPGLTATIGAALLGAATAITATRRPLTRAALATILASGYALVSTINTVQYLTIAYTAALAWWAIATTATTLKDASPPITDWLHRWTGP